MNSELPYIPYASQWVDEDDIRAVVDVLRSDWLTTGPKVAEFEQAMADFVGSKEAVAVSSGTAALHAAMHAIGIGPGDEVILPPITFVATANAVVFQGGKPVFADVDPGTLLIDPKNVVQRITPKTKAIIAVDYAGQPCDYDALREITYRHGLALVADACHALGARYKGREVGTLGDVTVFSFHPVKHITTGEGGMVTTDDPEIAHRVRLFRNHGITSNSHQRDQQRSWFYEMVDIGVNYRISDFQCALGVSQLRKLDDWLLRRRLIAKQYDAAFSQMPGVRLLRVHPHALHAYHLYVIRLQMDHLQADRTEIFRALRAKGVGVNVHYIPVHLHPYYRKQFATGSGMCPVAEAAYEQIMSLPIFPGIDDKDIDRVVLSVSEVIDSFITPRE